ncbi:MAG: RNA polymerase sigma factor RpoD/SigA [Patescibacteria group bacterium]|nr:RNA polymerase sigma factor RpoD/SigA [Patescibacteria group bacterium]
MAEGWMEDPNLRLYFASIASSTPLSREREVELAARIHAGDMAARDELVQANLRFVVDVAKNYQYRGLSMAELISAGNLGLVTAAERFDGTRGFKFISYAVWWIRQSILATIADQARTVRLPLNQLARLKDIHKAAKGLRDDSGDEPTLEEIADVLEISPEEISQAVLDGRSLRSLDAVFTDSDDKRSLADLLADDGPPPDQATLVRSQLDDISSALEDLDERERKIVRLYFGLDGREPMTLEEIGAEMNLTRERIRQLKERALLKLRHPARAIGLIQYSDIDVEPGVLPCPEELASRAKEHSGQTPKKQSAAKKSKPAPDGKNGSPAPRQCTRQWTPEQIAARNAKEATERAEEWEREARRKARAKRTKKNGKPAVRWVYDKDTDTAILETIDRLTKQLERAPTSYEVKWELHGQIPEEGIEKVAEAADARERATA